VKTVCVFCGAKMGVRKEIWELVRETGKMLAKNGIRVVCGGADCGLMKMVVEGAAAEGGEVIGIFPEILDGMEVPHPKLTELIRTPNLTTRKQKMIDLSDAFLIFPGGYGTLDEILEVAVLRRLNVNRKQIILFNCNGFWDFTLKQMERMIADGFVAPGQANPFTTVSNFDELKSIICGETRK
jgi:uncharacterized protein (TIGR00730 family)